MNKFFSKLPLYFTLFTEGLRFYKNSPFRFTLTPRCVKKSPDGKTTTIRLSYQKNKNDKVRPCTIVIYNEEKKIDFNRTTDWLFSKEYSESCTGSETKQATTFFIWYSIISTLIGCLFSVKNSFLFIGVQLLILVLINLSYKIGENIQGMSRYCIAVKRALKGKLDHDTEALLIVAMKKSWEKKLTFEDAQLFLDKYHLIKYIHGCSCKNETYISYIWFDDKKNIVAHASPSFNSDTDFTVTVSGSKFIKKSASVLLKRYTTKNVEIK